MKAYDQFNPTPLLSICIPTYNRSEYLKETLESLSNDEIFKKTNEVEIIISDNCSNDNTQYICEQYVNKHPGKIHYIKQKEPVYVDDHILKVLTYAKGKYLKLNNDTLSWKNGSVKYVIELIKSKNVGDIIFFLNNDNIEKEFLNCKTINDFLSEVGYFCTWIGAFCVKANSYNQLDTPNRYTYLKLAQVDILLRLINNGSTADICNKQLFSSVAPNNKGGYNIAQVFGKNFIQILKEHKNNKTLSIDIFNKIKKDILLNHINYYYFDLANNFNFNKDGYVKYLYKDYKYKTYFYINYVKYTYKSMLMNIKK